jgi:hypothetical protein
MSTVYVEKEKNDVLRMFNGSGLDIDQDQFVVLNGFNAIAENDVLNDEYGEFQVEEGLQVQVAAADQEPGENTFLTLGQEVYFTPSDTFSDTPDVTYTKAGILTQTKRSDGVIVFDKFRYAEAVLSDET